LVCYAQAVPSLRDDFFLQASVKVAARSNLGKRHRRNEDYVVLGSIEVDGKTTSWFVVCDGVSRSKNPQAASEIGARVAGDVLKQAALSNEAPNEELLRRAISAAQDAVSVLEPEPNAYPDYGAPASTIVAAFVKDGFAYLGWCGDSRIYSVDSSGGALTVRQLSRDHSVLNEYLDEGMSLEQAMAACPANELHAMVQCLVHLSEGEAFKPSFATVSLEHTSCLLGCTDGVWNDAHPMDSSDASKFAEWFTSCQGDALSFATQAVNFASGVDNDTCAVILF
jgi:serine/threonine protein phosphatase PrpC